ncbi:MAG: insulinase family protein, partial [Marivivens sp.]|nr:insulinase family protein [Marivivens sp.]
QRVAADRLPLMMQMEADRMVNLRLSAADIATERDVILEERNMRVENNPSALAREQMMAAQYLNHRYGVPVIGWKHEMESLELEDALSFYDLYYSPNNAVLVVAGDVDPNEVRTLADQYYGVIPPEENLPERLRAEEPPQTAARRLTFVDPRVSQPYLARSYLAPERDSGDQRKAAALVYLAEMLGGSPFSSALGTALRTQLRAGQIYARDNVEGLANRYGAALSQGLTVQDVQDWPAVLEAVTAEDIKAVAAEVLDPKRSVTMWVAASEGELK